MNIRTLFLCGLSAAVGTIAGSWIAQAQAPETLVRAEPGVIAFIVDGREQARLDARGLHVDGDVAFTGTAVDTGVYPHEAGAP